MPRWCAANTIVVVGFNPQLAVLVPTPPGSIHVTRRELRAGRWMPWLQGHTTMLVGGIPTPLKNMSQLGWIIP